MSKAFLIFLASVLLSLSILSIITFGVDAASFQTVYSGLSFPVAFTFAHDGRMFFNEKNTGNVRVIASNGTILIQPFANLGPLPPTAAGSEEGLLGLALGPNFDTNHYLYVYWTYWDGTQKHVRITRFTDVGSVGTSETTIFDFVDPNPGPTNHNGGYIKFGLDGKLYVTVGDFCSWECSGIPMAQDKTNYAGKILRMNSDGSVPSDNPFSGSLVYAYGFRNGIGLDFNSTGGLIATMAGPGCCDRTFFVNSGANLGWPNCGTSSQTTCSPPYTPSLYQWGSTVTPTGITYSSSSDRVLYFGEYNTGNFMQLVLTTSGTFSQLNTVAGGFSGGVLAVEKGPDGRVWLSTPNDILAYTETKKTATLTATQTSTLHGIVTSTFTSYTSTTTSTTTVPTVLTVVLVPVTSAVQGTQYQTSFVTVTNYASTSISTSTIPTITTVTVGPPTSTIQTTQILTTTATATATSVTTTSTTSYTGTQFSTSTTVVVTTVTTTSSSFGEALILLSMIGLAVGFGVETDKRGMVSKVLLRVGRRCVRS